jgi:catechol 2,3-dioxygenase-like lactoylglutathione lyase family enzyme
VVTSFREAFPIVTVADVDRAIEFYTSVFGFEKGFTFDEGGKTMFAFLELEPLGIGVAARSSAEDPDFALWRTRTTSTPPPSVSARLGPMRYRRRPTSRGASARARFGALTATSSTSARDCDDAGWV